MRHIIQREIFDLSIPDQSSLQHWEGKIEPLLNNVINPCIEECFDNASGQDQVYMYDQIELDLGVINGLSNEAIKSKIKALLGERLKKEKEQVQMTSLKNKYETYVSEKSEKPAAFLNTTCYLFAHYLIHGQLPWWAENQNNKLKGEWVNELSEKEVGFIAELISSHAHAIPRLTNWFDKHFLTGFIANFYPLGSKDIQVFWDILEKTAVEAGVGFRNLHKIYWGFWISLAVGHSRGEYESRLVDELSRLILFSRPLRETIRPESKSGVLSMDKILKIGKDRKAVGMLENILKKSWKVYAVRQSNRGSKELGGLDWKDSNIPEKKHPRTKPSEITFSKNTENSDQKMDLDKNSFLSDFYLKENGIPGKKTEDPELFAGSEPIFCRDAGLVIVHPFLKELFKSAGFWEEEQWKSNTSQDEAVHLLTWLGFGNAQIPEYDMVLPKILCGMPIYHPLESLVLKDSVLDSARELLESIIRHWEILGNTSIDGLREGFFHREGKITYRKEGWKLAVEKKAQDILLNKLPWGISMVSLPWLNRKAIFVDWT
ncbi:contractile injection system tape measure protein [Lunatibacter salilacus]|uniref:contractile injection system tape measure protein n=1 Tax=Lunatibacter salilacus TaxID=2483804 RepID=UPI00131CECC6|nr:contractile injection system tape measure protein [Lunatibacter salilacus]